MVSHRPDFIGDAPPQVRKLSTADAGTTTTPSKTPVPPETEIEMLSHVWDQDGAPADSRFDFTARRRGIALLTNDFVGAAAAIPLALLLLSLVSNVPMNSLSRLGSNVAVDSLFPVMVLLALAVSGFYRSAERSLHPSTFIELKDLSFSIGMGAVLTLGVGAAAHRLLATPEPPAAQLVVAVLVAIVLIAVGRSSLRAVRQKVWGSRIVLVGSGELTRQVQAYLKLQKGNDILGHVIGDDDKTSSILALKDPDCLGTLSELPRLCRDNSVERIVVCFPTATSPDAIATLRSVQPRVKIAIVPRYFELISWRSTLTDLYGLPLLEVADPHLSTCDRLIKRTFDIIFSTVLLLVFSPLFALIAILIKLSSPGPVLFRQPRTGRAKHLFTIFKFRTMRGSETTGGSGHTLPAPALVDASHRRLYEVHNKVDEQRRVTSIGKFLRKTSLDEAPQLLNVLRGQMSLVGPRPFVPDESEDQDGWTALRFQVRPGITGLWQVCGRNNLSIDDLRRLDYVYVSSWSMWWDMKILWETPRVMVKGMGAY